MPDEALSPSEAITALSQLFDAESWEHRFQILEQEQATLLHPLTRQLLLAIIEQKQQEEATPQELSVLEIYYMLLERIRELGLPAAWGEFIDALIDEDARILVGVAFEKFIDANTLSEMQQIFEQERNLLLSDDAELLWQRAFAHALQAEGAEKEIGLEYLRLLKGFFDLMHAGDAAAAWTLLQDRNKLYHNKIIEALDTLAQAQDRETMHMILEQKQTYLLTDEADQILNFHIQQAEQANADSYRDIRLQGLLVIQDLLRNARIVGVPQAIQQVKGVFSDQEQAIGILLDQWLNTDTVRAKRRFLEAHLEMLQPLSEVMIQKALDAFAEDLAKASVIRSHLQVLHAILKRGQTIQAICDGYVDQGDGFSLDIPSWLEAVEGQLKGLSEQEVDRITCIQLLRETISYAQKANEVVPEALAELQNRLGYALQDTPRGDPMYSANMEDALTAYNTALQLFTLARYPYQYARVQYRTGKVYTQRVYGDQRENEEKAIACFNAALCGYTFEDYPSQWAAAQGHLGRSYRDCSIGDKQENQEMALACFEALLQVYTREIFPDEWATAQMDLCHLYMELVMGERRENLERALAYAEAALRVSDYDTHPKNWAIAHLILGNAYKERIVGERRDNQELAISCYEAAASVLSRATFPLEWAELQIALGDTYRQRIAGKRNHNLERAFTCLEAALEWYSRETFPVKWATVQVNLSAVYIERLEGGRPDNLEHAIVSLQAALRILAKDTNPTEWAVAQTFLGIAFTSRVVGDRRENLEAAVAYCNAALAVFTREYNPQRWALLQRILAEIYRGRLTGESHENLKQAVQYCQNALHVHTRSVLPIEWATTHTMLGSVYTYLGRSTGGRQDILEQALEQYHYALQILTEETFPIHWAIIQQGLSAVYFMRIAENKADNLQQAIACGQSALRLLTRATYPFEWAGSHTHLGEAYRQATFYADLQELYSGRAVMQEQAIRHLEAALQVYTKHEYPLEWANAQRILGSIYLDRAQDKRYENLAWARDCFEAASQVFSREYAPLDWATIQTWLGIASLVSQDERKIAIERSIVYFEKSLEVCNLAIYPIQWATNQANLSLAYIERIEGDQQQNVEQAIHYGQAACSIYARENTPLEWAEALVNLSIAYFKRISGEQRVNMEQAIAHCEQALRVFSRDYAPFRWALVQINLSLAYGERFVGDKEQNQTLSMQHAQYALEVYTEENAPGEWAVLQVLLGTLHHTLMKHAKDGHATLAEAHYRQALRVYTYESYPLDMARTQLLLGLLYHSLARDKIGDKERVLACYQTALSVLTRETMPVLWAAVQYALGACHAFLQNEQGASATETDLAVEHIEQSLAVLTLDGFPHEHRSNQQALLFIEWQRQNWQAVNQATQAIYQAEKRLLQASTGISGFDFILAKSISPSTFGAFALLQQGEIEQAVITLERGRAQSLAQAMALYLAAPERIQKLELRTRYTDAHRKLQQVRAKLAQMAALSNQPTSQDRRVFLECTNACEVALCAFDDVVSEIRIAQDPANFLADTVSIETLQRALAAKDPGHALVYLAALPNIEDSKVGGFALAVLPTRTPLSDQIGASLRFAYCEFPDLTYNFVLDLVHRGTEEDPSSIGGLAHAQALNIHKLQHRMLTADYGEEQTLRDVLIEAIEGVQASTIFAALATCLQDRELEPFLDKPYKMLQEKEIALWSRKSAFYFLCLELRYCQERLAPILLQPLYTWLQTLNIASLTLIPCGYLATLPITTLLLNDGRTLGEKIPTSIAPSALSLAHTSGMGMRQGVHAFGNPQGDLYWGEREACALAEIARQLHMESRKSVQGAVTRNTLFQSLQCAQVIELSCHGQVKSGDYLQSFLSLAKKSLSIERSQLTLADILNRERDIQGLRLLILSSCQSAIPDPRGAIEEVRSLSSAMLQAGAHAVLAPLWSVSDKVTYLLIVRFAQEWFPHMDEESPAAALARAQYWLRNVTNHELSQWETIIYIHKEQAMEATEHREDKRENMSYELSEAQKVIQEEATRGDPSLRPYADPVYWAAFQIAGW